MEGRFIYVFFILCWIISVNGVLEVDLGDGLKYATTFMPDDCNHKAQQDDVIHYHYVGRLGDTGQVFGRSFDYNSPYIVALGQGRIIAGMDRGLVGTCLWERRKIVIPPELGYGERGVGKIIPPNSTLVFYIRMIKIERDGRVLGAKQTLKDLYLEGLTEYTAENWGSAIQSLEKALELFDEYQVQAKKCLETCKDTTPELSKNKQKIIEQLSEKDALLKQYLVYAAKAKCIKKCKKENLPENLRNPDPLTYEKFNKRVPYDYLQFSYYKLDNLEESLRCALTYFMYNPNDTLITSTIKFYRRRLNVGNDEFPSRELGSRSHHQKYEQAKKAYSEEKWLEVTELMEEAVNEYMKGVNDCRLMCEDVVYVNFTDPDISVEKLGILEQHNLLPDSMDFYQLLHVIAEKVLQCHTNCDVWMAMINGKYYEKYLPGHFNHLQYAYYKLGMLHKSAEAASTFRVLEPSDSVMANNIKLYRSSFNVPFESFKARNDVSELKEHLETEHRILTFMKTGIPTKRMGSRGDNGDRLVRDEL